MEKDENDNDCAGGIMDGDYDVADDYDGCCRVCLCCMRPRFQDSPEILSQL